MHFSIVTCDSAGITTANVPQYHTASHSVRQAHLQANSLNILTQSCIYLKWISSVLICHLFCQTQLALSKRPIIRPLTIHPLTHQHCEGHHTHPTSLSPNYPSRHPRWKVCQGVSQWVCFVCAFSTHWPNLQFLWYVSLHGCSVTANPACVRLNLKLAWKPITALWPLCERWNHTTNYILYCSLPTADIKSLFSSNQLISQPYWFLGSSISSQNVLIIV